jgi:hypothetical protein
MGDEKQRQMRRKKKDDDCEWGMREKGEEK